MSIRACSTVHTVQTWSGGTNTMPAPPYPKRAASPLGPNCSWDGDSPTLPFLPPLKPPLQSCVWPHGQQVAGRQHDSTLGVGPLPLFPVPDTTRNLEPWSCQGSRGCSFPHSFSRAPGPKSQGAPEPSLRSCGCPGVCPLPAPSTPPPGSAAWLPCSPPATASSHLALEGLFRLVPPLPKSLPGS